MNISEAWLKTWVDAPVSTKELAHQLTMAGLEVGAIEPAAGDFSNVVVGSVQTVEPHPQADRLRVCTVDAGGEETLQIVCGAPNVAAGMSVPVAMVGAKLPGGLKIRKSKLRGVVSQGMICSASELGLGQESDGILALPEGGTPGDDVRDFLNLNDSIIEIDLTPNRGDCLGLAGVAREVGVLNRLPVNEPDITPVPATIDDTFPVDVQFTDGCPVYGGRIVRGIRTDATTPQWMAERLLRSGVRPIHPAVDVTNYVLLELGTPMHAFDLRNLDGGIVVRKAQDGETLTLLDGREVRLDPSIMIIADQRQAKALAGIMGGEDSGVADDTTDIFFEAAFFAPLEVAGRARRFGLHTDASHRFERGVDPNAQATAIERATRLLMDIAGGEAGPLVLSGDADKLPKRHPITLRKARLERLLGLAIPEDTVTDILTRLQLDVTRVDEGWTVTPPGFRFDLEIEEDLVEEVARIHGYDKVPTTVASATLPLLSDSETRIPVARLKTALVDRGYQEAITYSFVDPRLQDALFPDSGALRLANPISSDLSDMRVSLLPGLLTALKQNVSRQHDRVRLFETGLRFVSQSTDLEQKNTISGVACGPRLDEQWGAGKTALDFFDVKADVEALLARTGNASAYEWQPGEHSAMHPGQTAEVRLDGVPVGHVGALHPQIARQLDITESVFVFEIDIEQAFAAKVPLFAPISKFPMVRRDIAFLVQDAVSAATIQACVLDHAPPSLRDVRIFDIYRGKGIDSGLKSVALGLILQDSSRTLTDEDAERAVQQVGSGLQRDLAATIRD
ncbi:MAG: phenylalanine--tRNA ligase subunit beta [Pseudomonadota bacterium]